MSKGAPDPDSPVSTALENETETENPATTEAAEPEKPKLDLKVDIRNVGPCKKHVAVAIDRAEITKQFAESLGSMRRDAKVPGFRPGHAPLSLIEKRFKKEVSEQVKQTLLVAALEQLDLEYKLKPITQPQLDIAAIAIPETGPLQFEMEVEVRPDFPLPDYKNLTVNKPTRTITDSDVDAQLTLFLEKYGQKVPKLEGGAEIGDFIIADLTFTHQDGRVLNEVKEKEFRLQHELRFQDGYMPSMDTVLGGVKPGESREGELKVGSGSPDPSLRGTSIKMTFAVQDLKQTRLPEVNAAFLNSIGFDSREELREALRQLLVRRLSTQQRQVMRSEIMDKLIAATSFDLPADLVARQEKSTLRRLAMEMKQGGLSDNEIRAREANLKINARESTLRGLKEYFILEQISEAEEITVEEVDFDEEIETIAARSDESARRVRARIEKDNLAEALASQILERKTLDRIFDSVKYTEVPMEADEVAVETLDETAAVAPPEGEEPVAADEPTGESLRQSAAETETADDQSGSEG
jgi:trigger factor